MIPDKKALRKELKEIRRSDENKSVSDELIFRRLLESGLLAGADRVFLYFSVSDEVDTERLISFLLDEGIGIALPRCIDGNGSMIFYSVSSQKQLIQGMYGIKEPDASCCPKAIATCHSVCIVPGLSFDCEGFRLGYGKGYYDRFLSDFDGISVGLCRENCRRDYLPRNDFDKRVDFLITEKEIINFNDKEECCDG